MLDISSAAARDGAGGRLAAADADLTRPRLGLEGTWRGLETGGGGALTPTLEVGLRHDSGDAETGIGLEAGAGIDWSDPQTGIKVEFRARGLLAHEDRAFRNWSLGLNLAWDPNPETKRGWSLAARQSFGGASTGGVDALLGPDSFPGLKETGTEGDWSLEAARGVSRGRGMVGSSYGRVGGDTGIDNLRLGYRIEPVAAHAADASVDVWVEPGVDGNGHGAGAGLQWR